MDTHSKEVRSYNMSQIRSKDTKPELIVRKFLFSKGFRYRLHSKNLPGKPDIVLHKYNTIIFIHGCFWHSHENCKHFIIPKSKTEWWLSKFRRTKERDLAHQAELKLLRWKVIVIWECDLVPIKRQSTLHQLEKEILSGARI